MQERINRLESLVLELSEKSDASFDTENGAAAEGASTIDAQVRVPVHQIQLDDSQLLKDGHEHGTPTNWQTILEDVSDDNIETRASL